MKFFAIDSSAIQKALFDSLYPLFLYSPAYFRVDGIRDETNGNWYYNNGQTLAFSGLEWLISSDTAPGFNTLVVTNMAEPMVKVIPTMKVDGFEANSYIDPFFICEYTT